MTADLPSTLLDWAQLPGPAKVLTAVRRRLEAGHGRNGAPLRIVLTQSERDEVGRLLGITWALSTRGIRIHLLAEAISQVGSDLDALLRALHGPLGDRPAERALARAAAEAERDQAARELTRAGVADTVVEAWLASRGLPKAGTGILRQLAADVASVLNHLPATNETVLLSVLAVTALNDTHALDRGSRTAAAVLRIAAPLTDDSRQSEAEAWRSAWERLGVVCDELSSRVLVLNLPLHGRAAACRLTNAAAGEPLWLTWRCLTRTFTTYEPDIYVCENPTVVAAAANSLGPRCRPLICTNGRPSCATRRLIAGLAADGATMWIRADDDPVGHQIVDELVSIAPGARLWRYDPRIPADGQARYEEQDLDLLLADLAIFRRV